MRVPLEKLLALYDLEEFTVREGGGGGGRVQGGQGGVRREQRSVPRLYIPRYIPGYLQAAVQWPWQWGRVERFAIE